MSLIRIQIKGAENIAKLADVDRELPRFLMAARVTITDEILNTQGLKRYPPSGPANQPPVPYYIRGRGTQTATGNLGNSQRLGTKWQSKLMGTGGSFRIFNDVPYAHRVHGETQQAKHMARKGWRKLADVASEKAGKIANIYNQFIKRMLQDMGF